MNRIILKRIVSRLPYHKNKIISNRLAKRQIEVTPRQVKAVFDGDITNPEIRKIVLTEARKLSKESIILSRKTKKQKRKTKTAIVTMLRCARTSWHSSAEQASMATAPRLKKVATGAAAMAARVAKARL